MTVTFTAGTNTQVVIVFALTDSIAEDSETFTAVLSSPSAGVMIMDGRGTATVEITDNTDVEVEFDPITYSGAENSGTITFTIVKRTQATRSVSVLFSTSELPMQAEGICM